MSSAMNSLFPILTLLVTAFLWALRKSRKPKPPLPPGPRGLPLLGYLPFLGPITNLHRTFSELAATHGPIYKLCLGSKLWVIINSPSLVKEMIHHERDPIFMNRSPTIAASIITYQGADMFGSQGLYWRDLRKIFAGKMLSNANVDACYDIRRQVVHKAIRDARTGIPIDVDQLLYVTVTNVVISMAVGGGGKGTVMDAISDKFRNVLEQVIMLPNIPNISDMLPILAWFDIQGIEREAKKVSACCDQMLTSLIQGRIQDGYDGQRSRKDFLQILLELKDTIAGDCDTTPFTTTQLKALLMDIIIGGTDAPAKSANWVMRELMKHPEAMKRVKTELTQVVGHNDIVEEMHLPKLQYLDAVIKETFRLHPPVPLLIPRSPNQSSLIGGYTIPKGSQVFLNAWSIHRDPLAWENPLEFRPERFLDDTCRIDYLGNNPHFFPFGSGRRMCAGLPLARKMLPYVLASFLHSFDWELQCGVDELDLSDKYEFILSIKHPLIAVPTPKHPQMDRYLHSY